MRSRALSPLVGIGNRVASVAMKPVVSAAAAAVDAGVGLERRAVDLVLDSAELERVIESVLEAPRIQAALRNALASDGLKQVIAEFFDGGAFDALVDGLLASDGLWRLIDGVIDNLADSDALWRLIDEVAGSPAVTAAITQQGLGFADQVGEAVRVRSRNADDLLDRVARRLTMRRINPPAAPGEPPIIQAP